MSDVIEARPSLTRPPGRASPALQTRVYGRIRAGMARLAEISDHLGAQPEDVRTALRNLVADGLVVAAEGGWVPAPPQRDEPPAEGVRLRSAREALGLRLSDVAERIAHGLRRPVHSVASGIGALERTGRGSAELRAAVESVLFNGPTEETRSEPVSSSVGSPPLEVVDEVLVDRRAVDPGEPEPVAPSEDGEALGWDGVEDLAAPPYVPAGPAGDLGLQVADPEPPAAPDVPATVEEPPVKGCDEGAWCLKPRWPGSRFCDDHRFPVELLRPVEVLPSTPALDAVSVPTDSLPPVPIAAGLQAELNERSLELAEETEHAAALQEEVDDLVDDRDHLREQLLDVTEALDRLGIPPRRTLAQRLGFLEGRFTQESR